MFTAKENKEVLFALKARKARLETTAYELIYNSNDEQRHELINKALLLQMAIDKCQSLIIKSGKA